VDFRSWEKRGFWSVEVSEFRWERRSESVVRRFSLHVRKEDAGDYAGGRGSCCNVPRNVLRE
jgi:hypothetical protein